MIKFNSGLHQGSLLSPFSPRAAGAWGFFRCKLWLMSFWLESRKRHFHYGLSKCILLEAVKSMGDCGYACVCVCHACVSCECRKERMASLDDETHLMIFLIWFPPKPRLLGAWGSGGPDHFRKWGVWLLSSDWLFLSLLETETWAITPTPTPHSHWIEPLVKIGYTTGGEGPGLCAGCAETMNWL